MCIELILVCMISCLARTCCLARSEACQALEVWGSQHGRASVAWSGEVPEHGRAHWHGQGRALLWKSRSCVALACFSCTGQVSISSAGTGVLLGTAWGVHLSGSLRHLRHGRAP
ncbi:hypothetical protein JCGZ_13511 [Jatropha curcas]|uniref:Secreted protein n=1 Tax=Jatropha curcas TaxID=180498 RepID=A0A067KN78_JATCU|nr:hypothetical protein JCGZ_13511 [Jatropha curcas]